MADDLIFGVCAELAQTSVRPLNFVFWHIFKAEQCSNEGVTYIYIPCDLEWDDLRDNIYLKPHDNSLYISSMKTLTETTGLSWNVEAQITTLIAKKYTSTITWNTYLSSSETPGWQYQLHSSCNIIHFDK